MKAIKLADINPVVRFPNYLNLSEHEQNWGPRYNDDLELILIINGEFLYFESESKKFYLNSGDILLIYPSIKHTLFKLPGKATFSCIHHELFSDYEYKEDKYRLEPQLKDVYRGKTTQTLIDLFYRVNKCFVANTTYSKNIMNCILKEIYLYLYEEKQKITHQSWLLNPMLEYISRHFKQNITRKDLANQFHITPGHINRIFKEAKVTPTQYLHEVRITQAKELLEKTNKTISEISYQLGYYDPFHFSRVFKKKVGISPKKYRD